MILITSNHRLFNQNHHLFPNIRLGRLRLLGTYWLAWWLLLAPAMAQTDAQTEISLQNVPIQDERLLVVNVHLENVQDLYGADMQFRYDPARLKVRDDSRRLEGIQISPGPMLASDDRFVVTNSADQETGLINFVFVLLKPAPPISGEGDLVTIVFEIVGDGPYAVEVAKAQLVSSSLESVPLAVNNLVLNGELEPVGDTGAAAAAIDAWPATVLAGGLILVGGLVVVAVLLYRRTRRDPVPAAGAEPASQRRIPKSGRSVMRSAVLLAEQGSRALEQGEHDRAYELFSRAIELDPANTEAWLGKAMMAEQPTEKRLCLQRVLALDPDNQTARAALEQLNTTV